MKHYYRYCPQAAYFGGDVSCPDCTTTKLCPYCHKRPKIVNAGTCGHKACKGKRDIEVRRLVANA